MEGTSIQFNQELAFVLQRRNFVAAGREGRFTKIDLLYKSFLSLSYLWRATEVVQR